MSIDPRVYFSEELEVRTFDDKKVGELIFSVQPDQNGNNYVIELHSKWQVGSTIGGVTSHATLNADLLIEQCYELLFFQKEVLKSQTVKVAPNSEADREVFFIQIEGEERDLQTEKFSVETLSSLVTMGTCYLYQRLAALGRGDLLQRELFELDVGCKLARVSYEMAQGENTADLRIKKESNKGNVLWNFEYGSDGRVKHSIEEDAQLRYTHVKTEIPKMAGNLPWTEDIEMISRYLDEKASLESNYIEYIRSHPRIRGVLSDYMTHILIRKPDDVFEATAEFFKAFVNENN